MVSCRNDKKDKECSRQMKAEGTHHCSSLKVLQVETKRQKLTTWKHEFIQFPVKLRIQIQNTPICWQMCKFLHLVWNLKDINIKNKYRYNILRVYI